MKRRILSVAFFVGLLFLSTDLAMAGRPPTATMIDHLECRR